MKPATRPIDDGNVIIVDHYMFRAYINTTGMINGQLNGLTLSFQDTYMSDGKIEGRSEAVHFPSDMMRELYLGLHEFYVLAATQKRPQKKDK